MHFSPIKWPNVRKIAGMMRIGKKYQLDDIFEEAWERLKAQFPENLEAYDSLMDEGIIFPDWIVTWYNDIISLGEEMALWSILPITYYLAIYYGSSAVSQRLMVDVLNTEYFCLVRYLYSRDSSA